MVEVLVRDHHDIDVLQQRAAHVRVVGKREPRAQEGPAGGDPRVCEHAHAGGVDPQAGVTERSDVRAPDMAPSWTARHPGA